MKNKIVFKKLILCLILILVLSLSFILERQIYNLINKDIAITEKILSECDLQVHYINVGQGDAIAIKLPDDKVMLIDCGTSESTSSLIKYLNRYIFSDNKDLNYFIVTHPHSDHIGGASKIFETFNVNTFLIPYIEDNITDTENNYSQVQYDQLITNAKNEANCNIKYIRYDLEKIAGEDFTIEFLSPFDVVASINDYSPIILLTFKNKKFVFTGDAEEFTENKVVIYHEEKLKDIDVLKVGHHGSNTSSSEKFIQWLNPKYSVISVGRFNDYSHPHSVVVDRLNSVNSQIFRTDNNGHVVIGVTENEQIITTCELNNRLPIRIQVWQLVVALSIIGCTVIILVKIKNKPDLSKFKNK